MFWGSGVSCELGCRCREHGKKNGRIEPVAGGLRGYDSNAARATFLLAVSMPTWPSTPSAWTRPFSNRFPTEFSLGSGRYETNLQQSNGRNARQRGHRTGEHLLLLSGELERQTIYSRLPTVPGRRDTPFPLPALWSARASKVALLVVAVVLSLTPCYHAMTTNGDKILNQLGETVELKGANWFGFNNGATM
eukprot:gene22612-29754_t